MDEPLIYTTKGNLPIASLEYSHKWEDLETCIKFSETYTFEGEVVKQSAPRSIYSNTQTARRPRA